MKPTLLILAAGIGSRYGGVKQMDKIGPGGESIIDYSVYDAIRAGFGKIVFVINKNIEIDFREVWEPKLSGITNCEFVIQAPDDLPEGFSVPDGRVKPWGTGQAVMAARHVINTPFAVINADDFYGMEAYQLVHDYLMGEPGPHKYCMVGYHLLNTLSDFGTVSRGVCTFNSDHFLSRITEITNIGKRGNAAGYTDEKGQFVTLGGDTLVSMNIWGFKPGLFHFLEKGFSAFLKTNIGDSKAEFLLPTVINDMVGARQATVRMLETSFAWFGVTYQEDKPMTIQKVQTMVEDGIYPSSLWNR